MKNKELRPIQQPHSNFKLLGDSKDVADLHCTKLRYTDGIEAILSVWYMPLWTRIKFLFDGRVNLSVFGKTHPPANISVGKVEFFMEENK